MNDKSGTTFCFGGGPNDQVGAHIRLPRDTRQITLVWMNGKITCGGGGCEVSPWASRQGAISPWMIQGKANKYQNQLYPTVAPVRGSYQDIKKYQPGTSWAQLGHPTEPYKAPALGRSFKVWARAATASVNGPKSVDFRDEEKKYAAGDYSIIHGENYFNYADSDNGGLVCIKAIACHVQPIHTTTPAPVVPTTTTTTTLVVVEKGKCHIWLVIVPLLILCCGVATIVLTNVLLLGEEDEKQAMRGVTTTTNESVVVHDWNQQGEALGESGKVLTDQDGNKITKNSFRESKESVAARESLAKRRKKAKKLESMDAAGTTAEQEDTDTAGASSLDARRNKKKMKDAESGLTTAATSPGSEAESDPLEPGSKPKKKKPKKKVDKAPLLAPDEERAAAGLVNKLGISKMYARKLVAHQLGEHPDLGKPPLPGAKDKKMLQKAGIDPEKESGMEELRKLATASQQGGKRDVGADGNLGGGAGRRGGDKATGSELDDARKKRGGLGVSTDLTLSTGSDSESGKKSKAGKKKAAKKKSKPAPGAARDSGNEKTEKAKKKKKGLAAESDTGAAADSTDPESANKLGALGGKTKKTGLAAASRFAADSETSDPERAELQGLLSKDKKKAQGLGAERLAFGESGSEASEKPKRGDTKSSRRPKAQKLTAEQALSLQADRIATEKALRKAGMDKNVAKKLAKAAANTDIEAEAKLNDLQKKALRDAKFGDCQTLGNLRMKINKKERKKELLAERNPGVQAEQIEAERALRRAGVGRAYAKKLARHVTDRGVDSEAAPPPPPPELDREKLRALGFGASESAKQMRAKLAAVAKEQELETKKRLEAKREAVPTETVDVKKAAEAHRRKREKGLKTVKTITAIPEKAEVEKVLLKAGLGKSHARKLARRLGDPDLETVRLDKMTELEAKALAELGFGDKEVSAETMRGWVNAACKARKHKEKMKKQKKLKTQKSPKKLEFGDAERALMNAGIKEAEAKKLAEVIADPDLEAEKALPASTDLTTQKILDTLGFGAGEKATDMRDWVAAQTASEKRLKAGALEAMTISENVTEKALLSAGFSKKTAKKLAQQCANADLDTEAALDVDANAKDLQLLQKMGLFGDTETVGNMRMFLHQKLEQKYGTDEHGNLNTDIWDRPITAGMTEEAFLAQGFSKKTAKKLGERLANGAELNTEELQKMEMNGRELEILTDLCGDCILEVESGKNVELAGHLEGFVRRKKAEKENVIALDLSAAALPSLDVGNAESILVAKGFELGKAKKVAKALVNGDEAVNLEAGTGLTKDAKELLSAMGAAAGEDADGMLHLSASALEQIKDMLADEIEDDPDRWRNEEAEMSKLFDKLDDDGGQAVAGVEEKAPTDEEILKDLGVDLPDEPGDLRPQEARQKGLLESVCCCCPCCFEDEADSVAGTLAAAKTKDAKRLDESQQPLLGVVAKAGDAPSSAPTTVFIDLAAGSRQDADARAESFAGTMRGEAERALLAAGFSPAHAQTLSTNMTSPPALQAPEAEVVEKANAVLEDEQRSQAEAAGLTGVVTLADLAEQLLEKQPQHFQKTLLIGTDADPRGAAASSCLGTLLSEQSLMNLSSSGLMWLRSSTSSSGGGHLSSRGQKPGPATERGGTPLTEAETGALEQEVLQKGPPRRLGLLESVAARRAIARATARAREGSGSDGSSAEGQKKKKKK
eukprot:g15291.t1